MQLASGGDIVTINPDGSNLQRLTTGIDPVLSPDGQTVAFTRWQGETGSLWLMDSAGGNERSVLGFIKQAKGPEWSPDGSQIVLNFQQGGRIDPKGVCTDLTQSHPAQPPQNATDIRFSLDNNGEPQLCWELPPDPHWSLRVVNISDGSYQDLDGGTYAFRPAWDPSQTWRIVSDGGHGLLAVDPTNNDYRETISTNVRDSSPVFSPDGRYLAVSAGPAGGGSGHNIYRLNRDGSGRVQLTETPLWVAVQPDSDGQQWNNVAPTWLPDGSQIAFLTDRTGPWEIWLMNSDGSDQHPMFSAEINVQLPLKYDFVDERVLSWR
jgi:Tol biopolymer transport system component